MHFSVSETGQDFYNIKGFCLKLLLDLHDQFVKGKCENVNSSVIYEWAIKLWKIFLCSHLKTLKPCSFLFLKTTK